MARFENSTEGTIVHGSETNLKPWDHLHRQVIAMFTAPVTMRTEIEAYGTRCMFRLGTSEVEIFCGAVLGHASWRTRSGISVDAPAEFIRRALTSEPEPQETLRQLAEVTADRDEAVRELASVDAEMQACYRRHGEVLRQLCDTQAERDALKRRVEELEREREAQAEP